MATIEVQQFDRGVDLVFAFDQRVVPPLEQSPQGSATLLGHFIHVSGETGAGRIGMQLIKGNFSGEERCIGNHVCGGSSLGKMPLFFGIFQWR